MDNRAAHPHQEFPEVAPGVTLTESETVGDQTCKTINKEVLWRKKTSGKESACYFLLSVVLLQYKGRLYPFQSRFRGNESLLKFAL